MPGIMSAVVLQFLEYWNLIEQPLTFLKDKVYGHYQFIYQILL